MSAPTRLAAYRDIAILTAVLVLYGALSWFVGSSIGPFRGDPDYPYLFGALDMLVGKSPNYYDHPGTPVQMLIALGALATWVFTLPWHGAQSVLNAVLAHSQFYLGCICALFGAVVAGAMAFFVWSFRATIGLMGAALVGLFSIFTSIAVYPSFHQVSPEPLLLAGTLVLAALAARTAQLRDDSAETKRLAIWIGIVAGFCVTAKVTSAPVLLTLLFLPTRQTRKTALVTCAIAAAVFVLPILPRIPSMLHGYWNIATHQGDYGLGAAGAPSPLLLGRNLILLWGAAPETFLSLALFTLILAAARIFRRPLPRHLERLLILCAAVIFCAIILVCRQPRAYYLIPALGFVCLGNAIAALLVLRRIPFARLAAAGIIAALCVRAFDAHIPAAQAQAADWRSDQALIIHAETSGCLPVSYYWTDQPEWDLYFGNLYTNAGEFNARLAHLFPDFIIYNGVAKRFETFLGPLGPDAAARRLAGEKCVYLIGGAWQENFGIPAASLDLVAQSRGGHALYALKPGWQTP